jgi:hypothetical protein
MYAEVFLLCPIVIILWQSQSLKKAKNSKTGWIVAIILILVILFGVWYVFETSALSQQPMHGCVANTEFLCQNPVYNHNGDIVVTLGQGTGANWTSANFVFVPQGTQAHQIYQPANAFIPNVSFISYPANTTYGSIGLKSGQQEQISLPINNSALFNGGLEAEGSIWAEFTTQGYSTPQYTQIATISINTS